MSSSSQGPNHAADVKARSKPQKSQSFLLPASASNSIAARRIQGTMNTTPSHPGVCPLCSTNNAQSMAQPIDLRIWPCCHEFHRLCLERYLIWRCSNPSQTEATGNHQTHPSSALFCPVCGVAIRSQEPLQIPASLGTGSKKAAHSPSVNVKNDDKVDGQGVENQEGTVTMELRRGKWTAEEETYAEALIAEFQRGKMRLPDGTTLRNFLARLLHCDPMRISKKFVGAACIGKQVYRAVREKEEESLKAVQLRKDTLVNLETKFREKLKKQQEKRAKRKAAESNRAARAAAAAEAKTAILSNAATNQTQETAINSKLSKGNDMISSIPSVESFSSLFIPRNDSFSSELYAFPRVQSYDNMMLTSLSRTASTESFGSMLPRVGSLDKLAAAASDGVSTATLESSSLAGKRKKGVPLGGLPRVPSLDKALNLKAYSAGNSAIEIPLNHGSTSNSSATDLSTSKLSRDSSFSNITDYAFGCGLSLSRPPSDDKLNTLAGRSALPKDVETHNANGSSMPRNSSIEDIMAFVGSSSNNSEGVKRSLSSTSVQPLAEECSTKKQKAK